MFRPERVEARVRMRDDDESLDMTVLLKVFDQIGALQALFPQVKRAIDHERAPLLREHLFSDDVRGVLATRK
jgi:hypothetical protein